MPEDAPKRQNAQRYVRILRDECQRDIDLIDDMLTLSRLDAAVEPLMLSAVHLQDWIPAIADAFVDRMQSRQQTLLVTVPLSIPACTTDLSYLERILTELLTNACKYTPAHETVAIAATATPHHVTVTVSNTGSHIPAVECDRIFETFYRIPNHDPWKHGGTGIGLALVKKLTAQIGGTIVSTAICTSPPLP
ncbi:MAG: HAMP domain-containing histidine kinase [Kaiparowitsia implicata GSE-PSE-MK54-09C]|nr:HAMP domain-containing histidine kinase [Kaiparowitsia implicata GSE-PSE-MK54-09C]